MRRRSAGLAGVVLAAALVVPMAAAQSDDDATAREAWAVEPREVWINAGKFGFRYHSNRTSELGEDHIYGAFDVQDARYTFRYDELEAPEGAEPETITIDVSLSALIEFRDANGNGRFELGDRVVNYLPIQPYQNDQIVNPDFDQEAPYELVAVYQLPSAARLVLSFLVSEEPVHIGGQLLKPTQSGFHVAIEDYAFSSPDTMLALETHTSTLFDGDLDRGDASTLVFTNDRYQFTYRWVPRGTVDGNPSQVGVTALQFKTPQGPDPTLFDHTIIFAYPQGELIEHDPIVGVRKAPEPLNFEVLEVIPGDWRLYLAGLVVAMLVIGTAAALKARSDSARSPLQ